MRQMALEKPLIDSRPVRQMSLNETIPSVFYSWQSDRPRNSTRDIIREAAFGALSRLANRLPLEDSPRLDHDTLGESGTPAITESIYRKIETSAVFVADVTIVGQVAQTGNEKPKRLSNPNVLIELGYAAGRIGWDRIILVMNKHYGSPESLPFDLRSRRFPTTFDLGPQSQRRDLVIQELTLELESALGTCLSAEYDRVDHVLASLSSYARALIRTNGAGTHFWETTSDNAVVSRLDLAVAQLLDREVIRCVDAATESGLAYVWTYLGRQCARKLGVVSLATPLTTVSETAEPIMVDLSSYDVIGEGAGASRSSSAIEPSQPHNNVSGDAEEVTCLPP